MRIISRDCFHNVEVSCLYGLQTYKLVWRLSRAISACSARLEPAASKERTATGAVKEWTKEQMERRPVRVTFKDRGAATQRSGKSKGAGKEAGIDDGGLTNEMYAKYFDQLLMLRPDLFASTGAIGARALPTILADLVNEKRFRLKQLTLADSNLGEEATANLVDALLSDLTDAPDSNALERFVIYAMLWSMAGVLRPPVNRPPELRWSAAGRGLQRSTSRSPLQTQEKLQSTHRGAS